jgi:hypothetical protein
LSTTYEKPVMTVIDPPVYNAVKSAIESSMASSPASDFFKSVSRAGLRVREFEKVLNRGLLGKSTASEYSRLQNCDQGQIREFYLASLERVAPELREKFFKLYAYY